MTDRNSISSYYRKSSFSLRIARYIATFLFILFLLSCILIFGDDITAENIQLLAKYITLGDSSASSYTEEFSISAGDNSDVIMIGDNLAVVRNNNISLMDLGGQKLFSYDFSYSSPAVKTDDRKILIYDIEGKELSVFNTFSKIKTLNFDYNVTCADINANGLLAVSNEESYRSAIILYNDDYNEVYRWLSSENYVTDAVLSDDGAYILAVTAEAKDGSYDSSVMLLDSKSDSVTPKYSSKIKDELPVKTGFSADKDAVFVITDSNIHFYTSELSHTGTYKFNQSKVENYYLSDDMIVITERNNLSGKSMSITGLSMKGDILFNFNVYDEICDIAIGETKMYALGSKNVFEFSISNNNFKQTNQKPIDEKYIYVLTDSSENCYLTSKTKAKKFSFDKDEGQIQQ